MKKDYNLLLFGFFNSVYIKNLVRSLKKENPQAHIYYFGVKDDAVNKAENEYKECYDSYYLYEGKRLFEKIPILRVIEFAYHYRRAFRRFIKDKQIDIVNIHFAMDIHLFVLDIIRKYAKRFVITPWGSDVFYVTSSKSYYMLQRLYAKVDYVTLRPESAFGQECSNKFHVDDDKFYSNIEFGSEAVDYIFDHKDIINIDAAKKQLSLDNYYVITCGYKGEPGQQHLAIIDVIYNIKEQLPSNLLLLFPFTYGGNTEYRESVKKRVMELGLKAVFYEDFVDMPKLFLIRQATDLYIHVLVDDAGGASLKEYLACDKKVIVGGWLHFDDLEKDKELPYFVSDSLSQLGETIIKAYGSPQLEFGVNAKDTLSRKRWSRAIKLWDKFYTQIS